MLHTKNFNCEFERGTFIIDLSHKLLIFKINFCKIFKLLNIKIFISRLMITSDPTFLNKNVFLNAKNFENTHF